MLDGGLEATVTCVDPARLDPSFVGRSFDASLLRDLPAGVDPCGERGEFHTVCTAGPMFSRRVGVAVGGVEVRGGFAYAAVEAGP